MKSAMKEGLENAVMVEYKMHGKGAVDITDLSKYMREEEVLIPANTKFKVVNPLRKATLTEKRILWDGPEKEDGEETQQDQRVDGYVICLEEVEGPGSLKRQETGEAADTRREIREEYKKRLQELLIQLELEEQQELAKPQELAKTAGA